MAYIHMQLGECAMGRLVSPVDEAYDLAVDHSNLSSDSCRASSNCIVGGCHACKHMQGSPARLPPLGRRLHGIDGIPWCMSGNKHVTHISMHNDCMCGQLQIHATHNTCCMVTYLYTCNGAPANMEFCRRCAGTHPSPADQPPSAPPSACIVCIHPTERLAAGQADAWWAPAHP